MVGAVRKCSIVSVRACSQYYRVDRKSLEIALLTVMLVMWSLRHATREAVTGAVVRW